MIYKVGSNDDSIKIIVVIYIKKKKKNEGKMNAWGRYIYMEIYIFCLGADFCH